MKEIIYIPLAYHDEDEIKELVNFLEPKGYEILHGLNDVDSLKYPVVAVAVDTEEKTVSQSTVTSMAFWCMNKYRPLFIDEFIKHYERIVDNQDVDFYNQLLEEYMNDKDRPIAELFVFDDEKPAKPN